MDPSLPSLRAEGLAGLVVRELGLGVGERVAGTVLSELGAGRYEVRLGGRVLKVESSRRLEVGSALQLAVRNATGKLVLEILDHRPSSPPAPGQVLGDRLRALGLSDDASRREALAALMEAGVPVTSRAVETVRQVAQAFPSGEALARRAAVFLLRGGRAPEPALVASLIQALKGGAAAEAWSALGAAGPAGGKALEALLAEGLLGLSGPNAAAAARGLLEDAAARLLAADPVLRGLDLARARLGPAEGGVTAGPRAEALLKDLLAMPEGPSGDAEAAARTIGEPPEVLRGAAGQIEALERQRMADIEGLASLREAHRALRALQSEEAGRLLWGRDGTRYAEGVFRPAGGGAHRVRLAVRRDGRERGGSEGGRERPFRVGMALQFPALGAVGADLLAEGARLAVTLRAERVDAEALLSAGKPGLVRSLEALGFQPSISVQATAPSDRAPFFPELGGGASPVPVVDLKA